MSEKHETHPEEATEKKAPLDQPKTEKPKEIADEQLDNISGGVKPLGYFP